MSYLWGALFFTSHSSRPEIRNLAEVSWEGLKPEEAFARWRAGPEDQGRNSLQFLLGANLREAIQIYVYYEGLILGLDFEVDLKSGFKLYKSHLEIFFIQPLNFKNIYKLIKIHMNEELFIVRFFFKSIFSRNFLFILICSPF